MKALRNAFKGNSSSSSQAASPAPPPSSPTKSSEGLKASQSGELRQSSELKQSNELKNSNNLANSQEVDLKDEQVEEQDRKRLFSKLTGLLGKDVVSLLSLPVSLFEPTSVLQTMVEPLRSSELLFKISSTEDPIDRICLVAAFCVSFFSYYVRTLKPFNPVLGETYEYVPPSKAYKSLCEQVSHHPPIGIAHSTCDEWTLSQESHIQTRFMGTSVDVMSIGDNHLKLHKKNDHYTWKAPNACIHNILLGKIYVEHYGTIPIKSMAGGETAKVQFKKAGWFGGHSHEVSGEVHDKDGNLKAVFNGKWNEFIAVAKVDEKGQKGAFVELWRKPHHESDAHKWKWDPFVDVLTELSDEMEHTLPPTDSRLRGDLRALSAFDFKRAGKEKVALEESQRRKRREREAQGKKWAPQYFKKVPDDEFGERWELIGTYWEDRAQRLKDYKEKQQKAAEEKEKKQDILKGEETKGGADGATELSA